MHKREKRYLDPRKQHHKIKVFTLYCNANTLCLSPIVLIISCLSFRYLVLLSWKRSFRAKMRLNKETGWFCLCAWCTQSLGVISGDICFSTYIVLCPDCLHYILWKNWSNWVILVKEIKDYKCNSYINQ